MPSPPLLHVPPPHVPTGGIKELDQILSTLSPGLDQHEFYIFHTDPDAAYGDHANLRPVATVSEGEGMIFVVPLSALVECGSDIGIDPAKQPHLRRITLGVHSSLEAVGLTAAVSTLLAKHEISANVIAGYHHDHFFVPANDAERAVELLIQLAEESRVATCSSKENDCPGENNEDAQIWEGLMPLHIEKIVDHTNSIFNLPFKVGSKQISIEQDIEARRRPAFGVAAGDDLKEGCDLTEHDNITGAVLWDGAVVASSLIERCSNVDSTHRFQDQLDPRGKVVVELGCGCSAVPSQVAATLGAKRVLLTDLCCIVDTDILRRNIERNGLSDTSNVDLLPHKWGDTIPAELSDAQLILAADCIYDLSLVEPLLSSISNIMAAAKENGIVCVALVTFDVSIGRHKAYALFEQEAHARFESVEILDEDDISRDDLATESVKAYILVGLKVRD